MPGRKNPERTESEKEHEYHQYERRGKGEEIQGDLGEDLPDKGGMGEVRRRRQEWSSEHGGKE